jgi:hypothetical protein
MRLGSADLALAVVVSVLAGCGEATFGYTIVNDLDQRVRISQVFEGTEANLERTPGGDMIEPGHEQTFFLNPTYDPVLGENCQAIEVRARKGDGTIVARVPSPVCMHQETTLSSVLVP